jgi:hypothetical protein
MKSFDRIDEQPTAVDQPLLRLRNVYQDRRSGPSDAKIVCSRSDVRQDYYFIFI